MCDCTALRAWFVSSDGVYSRSVARPAWLKPLQGRSGCFRSETTTALHRDHVMRTDMQAKGFAKGTDTRCLGLRVPLHRSAQNTVSLMLDRLL